MKSGFRLTQLAFIGVLATLLSGCLLKSATVPARHFILAPSATNEPATGPATHLSVGIGLVKMPAYLLRDSLVVRSDANEIKYLDGALWAERLDHCFQRALADNLSGLLASDNIYAADWGRDQASVRVLIDVQQFDVDTHGRGTLIAQWRITSPGGERLLKNGRTTLNHPGARPLGNPEIIVGTLSSLTGEFSRELAAAIREAAKSSP